MSTCNGYVYFVPEIKAYSLMGYIIFDILATVRKYKNT